MPARLLANERFARKLACLLSPRVPAPVNLLCRELRCRPRALMRAAEELSLLGVRLTLCDAGWRVDPLCWRACQKLAIEYADAVDAVRAERG